MNGHPLSEITKEIQNSFQQGDYIAALKFAEEGFNTFADQRPLFYFWQITLNAALGKTLDSLDLLESALGEEIWFTEILLRRNPMFADFQDLPRFNRAINKNNKIMAVDPERKYPLLLLHTQGSCLAGEKSCPLLFGLHANDSTAIKSMGFWKPAAASDWLVAVPQSSQAKWKGAYIWDDRELSKSEIVGHISILSKQYSIDPDRVLLAGAFNGADIAAWISITGSLKNRGFIAINPTGPMIEQPEQYLDDLSLDSGSRPRGVVIIESEEPGISKSQIRSFVNMVNDFGFPCQVEEIPGSGISLSSIYESALKKAIQTILS